MGNIATRRWRLCALILATTATSARADLLTNWNLVTTGDLYAAHNVQGAVRVGGNLNVQNTFEAAAKAGSPDAANPSLIVGGNVKTKNNNPETIKVLQGDAVIGGAINGSTDPKGRVVSTRNGGTVTFDSSAAGIAKADYQELKADSIAFQKLEGPDQSIYLSTKQVDTAKFTVNSVGADGNAVFHVDGEALFENPLVRGFTLDLNGFHFGDGESIVFNVSGVDIDFRNGLNFDGAFRTAASNIIWNFFEATSIDLNRGNFHGSLLAPDAVLTNSNTIYGSVFVNDFGTKYGDGMNAAVNLPYYTGYDPSRRVVSTPEPASLVMAAVASSAALAWRARRRVAGRR